MHVVYASMCLWVGVTWSRPPLGPQFPICKRRPSTVVPSGRCVRLMSFDRAPLSRPAPTLTFHPGGWGQSPPLDLRQGHEASMDCPYLVTAVSIRPALVSGGSRMRFWDCHMQVPSGLALDPKRLARALSTPASAGLQAAPSSAAPEAPDPGPPLRPRCWPAPGPGSPH